MASDQRLTPEEVEELDNYGHLTAHMPLPLRAHELWEREILYGRVVSNSRHFDGLVPYVSRMKP